MRGNRRVATKSAIPPDLTATQDVRPLPWGTLSGRLESWNPAEMPERLIRGIVDGPDPFPGALSPDRTRGDRGGAAGGGCGFGVDCGLPGPYGPDEAGWV